MKVYVEMADFGRKLHIWILDGADRSVSPSLEVVAKPITLEWAPVREGEVEAPTLNLPAAAGAELLTSLVGQLAHLLPDFRTPGTDELKGRIAALEAHLHDLQALLGLR